MKRMRNLLLAAFPLLLTLTLLGISLLAGMRYLHAWLPVLLLSQLLSAFFLLRQRWKGVVVAVFIGCLPLLLAEEMSMQMHILAFFFAAYDALAYGLLAWLARR